MLTVRLALPEHLIRRLASVLAAFDLVFIAGMCTFIHYHARLGDYGPSGRAFIRYVLVQFHLGTENVLAAWYSSMQLLAVAIAALLAFWIERQRTAADGAPRRDRWLSGGWLLFAAVFTVLSLDELGSFHERIGMMVKLNKASLAPSSSGPVGWVYMLAIPIAVVGTFMLAFAWARLRHVTGAFLLILAGVALYLSDPVLEMIEGALVRSGSSELIVERILEEGVAELGGTLCFLIGVLLYASRLGADARGTMDPRHARIGLAGTGALLVAGVPIAHYIVGRLPAGDSGIPENWFPAAALFLVAVMLWLTSTKWRLLPLACIAVSAYFGAGLFIYVSSVRWNGYRGAIVDTLATAVAIVGSLWAAAWSSRRAPQEHVRLTS